MGEGKIISNGSLRAVAASVGECVLFGQHAGTEVMLNGGDVISMREEENMAVLGP